MSKDLILRLLRKEEQRLKDEYWHLSYTPSNLKEVQDKIRELGGYK